MVWAGRKADDPPGVGNARSQMLEETEDEYRRLLYVAMTRAADRLIIAGCMPGNRNSVREHSWYDLIVKRGLANSDLAFDEIPAGDGVVKSYRRAEDAAPETGTALDVAAVEHRRCRIGCIPRLRRGKPSTDKLRPSDPGTNEGHPVRSGESVQLRARAMLRGTLVHRLLQSLPDVAVEGRRDAALRYLARNAGDWTEGEREALAARMLALIGDPRFAPVFAPGSRAEVSIAGRLERPGAPAGAGFGTDRPAGGDLNRGPDHRLQDEPCPAAPRPVPQAMSGSLRSTGRCCGSFIPNCRSAQRCSGPKPLN